MALNFCAKSIVGQCCHYLLLSHEFSMNVTLSSSLCRWVWCDVWAGAVLFLHKIRGENSRDWCWTCALFSRQCVSRVAFFPCSFSFQISFICTTTRLLGFRKGMCPFFGALSKCPKVCCRILSWSLTSCKNVSFAFLGKISYNKHFDEPKDPGPWYWADPWW